VTEHPQRDPLAWLSRPIAGRTVPARLIEFARACLDRLVQIQFVDRAVALGSLAFTAFFPLLVLLAAYAPGADDVADSLNKRFHLSGTTADLVESAFKQPSGSQGTVSVIGVLLLFGSALSLTRALQRLYELSWRLETRGMRGTVGGLKWLLIVVIWVTAFSAAREWLLDHTGPLISLTIALASNAALWLMTPFVLLDGRVPWRRLVPTALLSAVGMSGLSVASVIYMPDAIATSADRYGTIGIAISLVSWLVGTGFVIVACTAVGAVLGGETDHAPPRPPGPAMPSEPSAPSPGPSSEPSSPTTPAAR
jgi:membrane protein